MAPNLRNAFGGVARLTVRRMLVLNQLWALLVVTAVTGLFAWAAHHKAGFEGWVVDFYLSFFLPLLAFSSASGAIRDDLRPASSDYLYLRPLPRWAYAGFKYVTHVCVTQLTCLAPFAAIVGVGLFYHRLPQAGHVPVLLLGQILVIVAASSFGFLCGMLTSRPVVLALIYGGVVEGGIGQIPTQLSRLSMLRQVKNFVEGLTGEAETLGSPLSAVLVILVFSAATLAMAAVLLHLREFSGSRGKES
ncbi:hypothetical protein DB347_24025 [Opitutaceae bacterium EW11]|nr:hypothetical protein DB347_24025 [Opitutaceae bacterium EW11]